MTRHYSETLPPDSPERIRPPRMHQGRPPNPAQQPQLLARLYLADERWSLSLLQVRIGTPNKRVAATVSDTDWLNLKVWADGRALHKANYWTAYSPKTRRFTVRGDSRALAAREPLHGACGAAMGAIANALAAGTGLDTMPVFGVRQVPEGFTVARELTEEQAATVALIAQLDQMVIGATILTLAPRAVAIAAINAPSLKPRCFTGVPSTLAPNGFDLTRAS